VNLSLEPDEEAFRQEVVAFLAAHEAEHGPVDGFFLHEGEHNVRIRRLYAALGALGWLSLTWPVELGGSDQPAIYEYVLWNEMAYARAARPPLGSGIVAKTIIRFGTEDQQSRFLPGLRAGTSFFSLGYSEPEAGSDLGGVRTRATRGGDSYVVNGEKRWTSGGHRADFLWTLCRTGALEEHSRGLTLLVIDRRSPGLTIAPIPALDGERFNEVRFDDVSVPAANRIGEEGGAWSMMTELLATERHLQFLPKRVERDFEELVRWVRGQGLDADPLVRHHLAELAVRLAEAQALALVMLEAVQDGRATAAEAAANKLAGSELCQRIARAAFELGANDVLTADTPLDFLWRQSISETIGGGTSEVMRGVVARLSLGLAARR
jgi:alkylation response protein AidB-like acyl-CoA dehydrogenase